MKKKAGAMRSYGNIKNFKGERTLIDSERGVGMFLYLYGQVYGRGNIASTKP